MGRDLMKIRLNEKEITVGEGAAVEEVCRQVKPDADVVIQNGFPAPEGALLREGGALVLIRRGAEPTRCCAFSSEKIRWNERCGIISDLRVQPAGVKKSRKKMKERTA